MDGEIGHAAPHYPATPLLASPGGHYSHAAVANGFVFVSGQLPITAAGEKLVSSPFTDSGAQLLASTGVVRSSDLIEVVATPNHENRSV